MSSARDDLAAALSIARDAGAPICVSVDLTPVLHAWSLVCGAALVFTATAHVSTHARLGRRAPPAGPRPPISILRPVRGLDDGLADNLAALAAQDYPQFEILVGAEDPDDPALSVVAQVRRDFPRTPIRIVTGGPAIGHNPKVNNLAQLLPLARHPHLLISDSNVRPDRGYLAAIADELADPRVGLVHNVLVGAGERSAGALLENLHLASFVVAAVCTADAIAGVPVVIGKSMLMHRDDLARAGGLEAVKDLLAEDYQLARRIAAAGRVVRLSTFRLTTINGRWDLRRFLSRHLRWAQMRRRQHLGFYALELLGQPTPLLLALLALALAQPELTVFGESPARLALAGLALKFVADAALWQRLRGDSLPLLAFVLAPLKDLAIFALWWIGLWRRRVEWRGHWMRIGAHSRLDRLESAAPLPAPAPSQARSP
ncbi:glycosyltransferase [Nannocystis radixulma]|uniref:Glycosyltransferase n=1 Tax=Nannocystis radixulma TaxID=2995305 RepID=A0ABT5B2Y3_9BACT|nr:glycosyltransferase [Nannocystis radixulma]MDC0668457.1 glycosyltransferase [Nannocystis radixulma]